MAKIRLIGGDLVDPFNPSVSDIQPHRFIHALSILNRFTGQSAYPYSVAQHTSALVRLVPDRLRRAAIVHDWSEAWFNDVASPVKKECLDYRAAEKKAGKFITYCMNVPRSEMDALDEYDKRIYVNERNAVHEVIGETGMGDNLIALPSEGNAWLFDETEWRSARFMLWCDFKQYFPEWFEKGALYEQRRNPFS